MWECGVFFIQMGSTDEENRILFHLHHSFKSSLIPRKKDCNTREQKRKAATYMPLFTVDTKRRYLQIFAYFDTWLREDHRCFLDHLSLFWLLGSVYLPSLNKQAVSTEEKSSTKFITLVAVLPLGDDSIGFRGQVLCSCGRSSNFAWKRGHCLFRQKSTKKLW